MKLTNDGKYSGTLDLMRYSGLQSQGVENIFFKVRMIPKDTSKNALSDYSEASVKLSIAGIFNTGSNSGGSSASGSADSTGSSDSSSDSSSSSTDIVNIGLHFILKNVRPYAASCSEA